MNACEKFKITRADGRSNQQVLIDYVGDCEPGRLFTYEELVDELEKGTSTSYSVDNVQQVVAQMYPRLLKEKARTLHNVRGIGYRVAYAGEHKRIALDRKRKADQQMMKGLVALQHVRWDEMDQETRKAHEGTLMLISGLCAQQEALEKRQSQIESLIRGMTGGNRQ